MYERFFLDSQVPETALQVFARLNQDAQPFAAQDIVNINGRRAQGSHETPKKDAGQRVSIPTGSRGTLPASHPGHRSARAIPGRFEWRGAPIRGFTEQNVALNAARLKKGVLDIQTPQRRFSNAPRVNT